jgi:hypothetical protein
MKYLGFFLFAALLAGCSQKSDFSTDGWNENPDENSVSDDTVSEKDESDEGADQNVADHDVVDVPDIVDENEEEDVVQEDENDISDEDSFVEPCRIENLEGVWVQRNILVTNSKSPIGTTTKSTTTTYNRIEASCNGNKIRFLGTVCEVDMENNSVVKITAPRQFVDHLDPIDRMVEIVDCEDKICLHQVLTAETRGVKMNDPLNDPLPKDGTNFDQDLDGNPGVTVIASGIISGKLFFIQRIKSEFTVEWVENSIISGSLWFEDNQFTLGSDPYGNGLEKQRDPITAILDESFTALKKIDQSMTCLQITEERKTLFD